jgi:hypothetical protein
MRCNRDGKSEGISPPQARQWGMRKVGVVDSGLGPLVAADTRLHEAAAGGLLKTFRRDVLGNRLTLLRHVSNLRATIGLLGSQKEPRWLGGES